MQLHCFKRAARMLAKRVEKSKLLIQTHASHQLNRIVKLSATASDHQRSFWFSRIWTPVSGVFRCSTTLCGQLFYFNGVGLPTPTKGLTLWYLGLPNWEAQWIIAVCPYARRTTNPGPRFRREHFLGELGDLLSSRHPSAFRTDSLAQHRSGLQEVLPHKKLSVRSSYYRTISSNLLARMALNLQKRTAPNLHSETSAADTPEWRCREEDGVTLKRSQFGINGINWHAVCSRTSSFATSLQLACN